MAEDASRQSCRKHPMTEQRRIEHKADPRGYEQRYELPRLQLDKIDQGIPFVVLSAEWIKFEDDRPDIRLVKRVKFV